MPEVSPHSPIVEMPMTVSAMTADSVTSQQILASPLRLQQTVLT